MLPTTTIIFIIVLLLITSSSSSVAQHEMQCLREFKFSVSDPMGKLSWNFANTSVGFVCSFTGVSCWNVQENRILSLSLSSYSLSGPLSSALFAFRECNTITAIDLSSNSLYGPIPSSICILFPFITRLNLSSNSLTGPILPNLTNCLFLNYLNLSSNHFSGSIPATLSLLNGLGKLNLSDNDLSGQIPSGLLSRFDASSFDNNPSLYRFPVSSERDFILTTRIIIIFIFLAFVFSGFIFSLTISYVVWSFWFATEVVTPTMKKPWLDRWPWAYLLPSAQDKRLATITLFTKPIRMLMLRDLIAETANFHPSYIVAFGSSSIGTLYEAVLPDGSVLIVKRLHSCLLPERQFRAEMDKIGQIRHPNLVPLLGFSVLEEKDEDRNSFERKWNILACFINKKILKPQTNTPEERILIYKNMPNGDLSSLLQSRDEILKWRMRLKIGVGVARGLAWRHHGFQVPILHHNLCSCAVLLDNDYEPRITDFGLARVFSQSVDSKLDTIPLLNLNVDLAATKKDVYDFGVVLLEVGTGRCTVDVFNNSLQKRYDVTVLNQSLNPS